MKRFYSLITVSNYDCDCKPLVEGQEDRKLLCTWTENIINDWVTITTNTLCEKPVTDMVTGVKIYPTTEDDGFKLFLPKVLKYDAYPQATELTKEEALALLKKIREDDQLLADYILFVQQLKSRVKAERKKDIREHLKIKV